MGAQETPPAPNDSSVDVGLALDIVLTQQQIGQMYGWLSSWGLSQASSGLALAWMASNPGEAGGSSHDSMDMGGGSLMPRMASDEDVEELPRSRGEGCDRLFLQLMIPHHRAGVRMAEEAARGASTSVVRDLAQSIVKSQKAEIDVLRAMLDARGGPVPGT